jgi:hypothetical protein
MVPTLDVLQTMLLLETIVLFILDGMLTVQGLLIVRCKVFVGVCGQRCGFVVNVGWLN